MGSASNGQVLQHVNGRAMDNGMWRNAMGHRRQNPFERITALSMVHICLGILTELWCMFSYIPKVVPIVAWI